MEPGIVWKMSSLLLGIVSDMAMGQNPKPVPPVNIRFNPTTKIGSLKWVVHLPQNGTIGFDPQPYLDILFWFQLFKGWAAWQGSFQLFVSFGSVYLRAGLQQSHVFFASLAGAQRTRE